MKIPAIGSKIKVTTKSKSIYYYSTEEYEYHQYTGEVIKNDRWVPADSFSVMTGNIQHPVSIISVKNVHNLEIISGKQNEVKVFKIKDYVITKNGKHFSCTCIGFKYHSKCKHITQVKDEQVKAA